MAQIKNIADINELLKSKGMKPVQPSTSYRLTASSEEMKAWKEVSTPIEKEKPEAMFIQSAIQAVIEHYELDLIPGFYEDEQYSQEQAHEIQRQVIYQVLNQRQILFEFFKKQCFDQGKTQWLSRYDEFYDLAVRRAVQGGEK